MDRAAPPHVANGMSRHWLIAVSTVAHVAVGVGLFSTSVWQIQQLDRPKSRLELGSQPPPPPPAAGGPVATVANVDVTRKRKKLPPPVITQPPPPEEPSVNEAPIHGEIPGLPGPGEGPEAACLDNCGPAAPAVAAVCGNHSREIDEQCDDGNTLSNDGCSATCRLEPRPPPPTAIIGTQVMQGLRLSGDTQVRPSASTQNRISRDGEREVSASVLLCISTDGTVASATIAKSTKYDDYDQTLLAAVRGWRYRPYTVKGAAVKACSRVTFVYRIL
jgi:TonB family protein